MTHYSILHTILSKVQIGLESGTVRLNPQNFIHVLLISFDPKVLINNQVTSSERLIVEFWCSATF